MNLRHQKVQCHLPQWLQEMLPQQNPVVPLSLELTLEVCHQQDSTNPQVEIRGRLEHPVELHKGLRHQECKLVRPNELLRLVTSVKRALQHQPQVELDKEILLEHPPEAKGALKVALGVEEVCTTRSIIYP